jgi:hypothetical protein
LSRKEPPASVGLRKSPSSRLIGLALKRFGRARKRAAMNTEEYIEYIEVN